MTRAAIKLRDEGCTQRTIADELGLALSTAVRWLHEADSELKPVRVIGPNAERSENATPGGHAVALVAPDGFRFEGLNVETAATLWRRLQ